MPSPRRAWRRWRRARGRSRNAELRVRSRAPKHLDVGFRRVIGLEGENTGVATRFHDFPPQIFERVVTHHPETCALCGHSPLGGEMHAAQEGLLGLLLPGLGNWYEQTRLERDPSAMLRPPSVA